MGRARTTRALAPAHHGRGRGVAAAAADRPRRPLPGPLRRAASRRSTRRCAPSTTWCARARCATSAARTTAPTGWPGRWGSATGAAGALRVAAAEVQPVLPRRVRARARAALPRGGGRRHHLLVARQRLPLRQVPPRRGAAGQRARRRRQKGYFNERGWRVLDAVDAVAEAVSATTAQVALAWIVHRPGITAPIASATSPEQLRELLGGVELRLDEGDGPTSTRRAPGQDDECFDQVQGEPRGATRPSLFFADPSRYGRPKGPSAPASSIPESRGRALSIFAQRISSLAAPVLVYSAQIGARQAQSFEPRDLTTPPHGAKAGLALLMQPSMRTAHLEALETQPPSDLRLTRAY